MTREENIQIIRSEIAWNQESMEYWEKKLKDSSPYLENEAITNMMLTVDGHKKEIERLRKEEEKWRSSV